MHLIRVFKRKFHAIFIIILLGLGIVPISNLLAQTTGEKRKVEVSATVTVADMERYQKEHPADPNERRIGSGKNGVKPSEEEEEEMPKLKVPRNAIINKDPFGKMVSTIANNPKADKNNQRVFSPIIDFNGIDDPGTVIPPDVGGQVGPNHVMNTHNGVVKITDRSGNQLSNITLNAFFSSVGSPSTFDPKVFYDPFNNRWVVVACGNAASANSALLLGVSANDNPTGTWKLYSIDVDATNTIWFDYPSVGFNKDWIAIGGNMFNVSNNGFNTGKLFVFNKADVYAMVSSPGLTVLNAGAGVCPAMTYDNTISTIYLLQNFNGNSGGNGFLGFYTLTGAVGSEVLSGTTFISTPNPWNGSQPVSNFAPQLGTANKVACNDSRIQKVVYRNGSLWCTHTVFLPAGAATRSSVQWWQISTAAAILQRGRIDDGTGATFYAFPSIDVNKNNDVMIGCAKFSSSIFPSACYALRSATDPVNTFQSDVVYKSGLASYFKTFSGTTNRWGDYTSTCVDPVDDMNFWTLQQYAKTGNNWGSWWAGVCTPPPTPGAITGTSPAFELSTGQVFSVAPVSGASSYTWNFPAGCVITAGNNTNSVTVTLGSTSGNVTVVANNGSCSSTEQSFALTINPVPALTGSASSNSPVCSGGTLNLFASASGGIPPYSFSWTGPNITTITTQNPVITGASLLNSGTYTVTITDSKIPANTITQTTTVTVNSLPTANITNATPLTFCSGDSVVLNATVANNRTYQWIRGSNNISGATANKLTVKTSGNYKVRITNTLTGCAKTSTGKSVTVNALPAVSAIAGPTIVCRGKTITLTNATPGGTWSSSDNAIATISSNGIVTGIIVGSVTITYTTAPNANGCVNKAQLSISVKPLPSMSSNITGTKTICAGKTTQLGSSTAGGTWSSSDVNIATVNPSTGLVSGVSTGSVTITYTVGPNSFGCTNQASATITVNPPCALKPVVAKSEIVSNQEKGLNVLIFPNPTGKVFNVQVRSSKQQILQIRVLNSEGKTVTSFKGMPGQTFHFGEQLNPGTYLVEVIQGEEVKTVKAVKVKQ